MPSLTYRSTSLYSFWANYSNNTNTWPSQPISYVLKDFSFNVETKSISLLTIQSIPAVIKDLWQCSFIVCGQERYRAEIPISSKRWHIFLLISKQSQRQIALFLHLIAWNYLKLCTTLRLKTSFTLPSKSWKTCDVYKKNQTMCIIRLNFPFFLINFTVYFASVNVVVSVLIIVKRELWGFRIMQGIKSEWKWARSFPVKFWARASSG